MWNVYEAEKSLGLKDSVVSIDNKEWEVWFDVGINDQDTEALDGKIKDSW